VRLTKSLQHYYFLIIAIFKSALDLVNSTTAYAYDLRTQTYFQPEFASQMLQRVLNANASSLESLHTQEELNLDRRTPVTAGTPLTDLINVGVKEPSISPIILTALMEELGKQTKYILQVYAEELFDQILLSLRSVDTPSCWPSTTSKHSIARQPTATPTSLPYGRTIYPRLA
jgi:hypothetical protein